MFYHKIEGNSIRDPSSRGNPPDSRDSTEYARTQDTSSADALVVVLESKAISHQPDYHFPHRHLFLTPILAASSSSIEDRVIVVCLLQAVCPPNEGETERVVGCY